MMVNCQDNEIIMPVTQEDEQTLQQTDVRFNESKLFECKHEKMVNLEVIRLWSCGNRL